MTGTVDFTDFRVLHSLQVFLESSLDLCIDLDDYSIPYCLIIKDA